MKTHIRHHCHLEDLKKKKEEEEAMSNGYYDNYIVDACHTPCDPCSAQNDQV